MEVEESVMGHTLRTKSGSIFLVPSAIGEEILELQEALKAQHTRTNELFQRNQVQAGNIDTLSKQLAESQQAYSSVVTEVGRLRAKLSTVMCNERVGMIGETDSKPATATDLRTYMVSQEAQSQRLELYKLVMRTLHNKAHGATIPELVSLRDHLI